FTHHNASFSNLHLLLLHWPTATADTRRPIAEDSSILSQGIRTEARAMAKKRKSLASSLDEWIEPSRNPLADVCSCCIQNGRLDKLDQQLSCKNLALIASFLDDS
ncbi:hypothetical protein HAX54_050555, partial [Datura stramonium]|nr:hypothetical protein [Datura stramonium]